MKTHRCRQHQHHHGFSVDEALEGIAKARFPPRGTDRRARLDQHVMPDMPTEELDRIDEKCGSRGWTALPSAATAT